jgi:cellulose synthase/poly-beta-1,6-N-acetylglucosamine synthase-like glycosyltransferase
MTMTWHIVGMALGMLILLATLPGSIEILLLTAAFRLRRKPLRSNPLLDIRLAIVIPAHDEAGFIGRCVTNIAESAPSPGHREIIVIADNCIDETPRLAAEAGAKVLVRKDAVRRGKGYALRFAFDQLQAEGFNAFLVIDADSMVSPNLVCEVVERLQAGAAAVQCRYRVANRSASIRTRLMDIAFLAFNVLRPKGREAWGLSAGILGNGFALSGATLQKVPYNADSIVEDLEYHLRLVAASERVEFVDEATVYGEMPAGGEAARAQRSRWEGGRLRMAREWVPRLASGIARGEWQWTEPLLDLLTLPLAHHVLLLSLALFLPAPFWQYSAASLTVVSIYVLRSSLLSENPGKTLAALIAAPFYIVWKVTTLHAVVAASGRGADWIRTARGQEPDPGIGK